MEILFWVVDNKKNVCVYLFINIKLRFWTIFSQSSVLTFLGGWGEESDIERLGYTVTKKPACIWFPLHVMGAYVAC